MSRPSLDAWQAAARAWWNTTERGKAVALIAGDWAGTPDHCGEAWESQDWQGILLRHVPLQPHWEVLEIGCGIGRLMRPLAARCRRIYGVDISESMIAFSQDYLAGVSNARTSLGSGYGLEGFADGTMDLVFSIITFQHIHDVRIVRHYLREIRRVLRPGGYCVLQVARSPRLTVRAIARKLIYYRRERKAPHATRTWAHDIPVDNLGNTYAPWQLRSMIHRAGLWLEALEEGLLHPSWLWATARRL